jgi:hypothetical protein
MFADASDRFENPRVPFVAPHTLQRTEWSVGDAPRPRAPGATAKKPREPVPPQPGTAADSHLAATRRTESRSRKVARWHAQRERVTRGAIERGRTQAPRVGPIAATNPPRSNARQSITTPGTDTPPPTLDPRGRRDRPHTAPTRQASAGINPHSPTTTAARQAPRRRRPARRRL